VRSEASVPRVAYPSGRPRASPIRHGAVLAIRAGPSDTVPLMRGWRSATLAATMTNSDADPLADPWGSHSLPGDECATIRIGPSTLRVRSPDGEIWLAHVPGDGTRGTRTPEAATDAGEEWVRWPVPGDAGSLHLSPVFCDRPVVVEPEQTFRLLPRTEARIFVRVPLLVRVRIPNAGGTTLTELPSMLLSDTWWGTLTEGEACYWLPTTARRRVDPGVFEPHLAVCPLQLLNRSDEELQVERIALRVPHLSVFVSDGDLWADETRVRYRGADEESHIQITGVAPGEAPGATRVTGPRAPLSRGLRARSFARLKGLSGLAGL